LVSSVVDLSPAIAALINGSLGLVVFIVEVVSIEVLVGFVTLVVVVLFVVSSVVDLSPAIAALING